MLVLALDTSTEVGSVALLTDDVVRVELSAAVANRHAETLLPQVERALALHGAELSDVELLAVGIGPGSFTGLRVGIATVKGLALGLGRPVVCVPSLAAIARGLLPGEGTAVVVGDAFRGEVFVGAFRSVGDRLEPVLPSFTAAPEEAARRVREVLPETPLLLAGEGLRKHHDAFRAALGGKPTVASSAFDFARAGLVGLEALATFRSDGPIDLASLEPLYVRPSDAKLPDRPLAIG